MIYPLCRPAKALTLVLLIGCAAIAPSIAANPVLPTVDLTPGESAPDLREFIRFTPTDTDIETSKTIEQLDNESLATVTENIIEFGPPSSPLLVLLQVRNSSPETGTWVFTTDRGSLRHIEMFEIAGQRFISRLTNDDMTTQREMLSNFHAFAYQFTLGPAEERILGVVFEPESSTKLPLSIKEPRAYESLLRSQLIVVLGATIGTLTLILLNAILFGVTGKTAFFHFVVAELALVFQALHLSGYTTIYLFYEHAELARALSGVSRIVFSLYSVRFIRSFLRTRETWPKFERPAKVFEYACWLSIASFALYPLIPFLTLRLASILSMVIISVALIGLPIIAAIAVKRYGWIYSPLVIGWSVWGIYLIYTILTVYTPLPEFPYQWRWMAPLGFFEALMLSIALGLDVRKMQQSESRAQRELSDALKNKLELAEATAIAQTDRAMAEVQLRETSSLVRTSGHDGRSFTGALKMYGQVISKSRNIEESRQYGAMVTEIANELDTTLTLIVEGSSESSASMTGPLRLETMEARSLLETVKQIHDQTARKQSLEIRCRSTIDHLTGDRHLLIRLLSNLLGNAVKYTSSGKILLSARRNGNGIKLEVWDQGPGISSEHLQRMLSPERKRERLNPEIDGTGSGLGICLELSERIQAKISAQSTTGRGSVFSVQLNNDLPNQHHFSGGIAILDDTAHWPTTVIDSIRNLGVSIKFLQGIDEVDNTGADLVIVDPATHPTPPDQDIETVVAICSYESSPANLREWPMASPIGLAKPVTADSLLLLLKLLKAD